jgi:hypothetical protein
MHDIGRWAKAKLYLYGYLNRVRSSRLLERETQRNIEVMWLLKKLQPDFKTIADFRNDNLEPLKQVCRAFTLLCNELDLFGAELIASMAASSKSSTTMSGRLLPDVWNAYWPKLTRKLPLSGRSSASQCPARQRNEQHTDLAEKLARLQARSARDIELQQQLNASEQSQISLTDPDSRSMVDRHKTMVGYNVQFATDSKHSLIVAHEVTNAITDQEQLAHIAQQAQVVLDGAHLDVLADATTMIEPR